jgi:6-phosphogluconate dehydrogenase
MKLGMIGLGRMGFNMTQRLLEHHHDVVVFDLNPESVARAGEKGAQASSDLAGLIAALPTPHVVWVMVPSGAATESTLQSLMPHLHPGDIVIDGGNSNYKESMRHAEMFKANGVHFLDCGTSGGVWGLANGYCLMIGGDPAAFAHAEPIFKALAPENGYLYVGASGAGHFTKMVHNGIEYGMLQAYAEGFEIMHASPFGFDLGKVSALWNHGSVVRSWLLELAERAFAKEGNDLTEIKGWVADSGEGRWTVQAAIDFDVPAPVITLSLLQRFVSRQEESYGAKVIATIRNEFGGHSVKKAE